MAIELTKQDPSLLTPFTRAITGWLAPRAPLWLTPNRVTVGGLYMLFMASIAFCLARFSTLWLLVAVVGLSIHWISDALDGEIARLRRLTSEQGFYLDLLADCVGLTALAIGAAVSGLVQPVLALLAIVMFLLKVVQSMLHFVLRQRFPMGRVGPTEAQFAAVFLTLLLIPFAHPVVYVQQFPLTLLDVGIVVVLFATAVEQTLHSICFYQQLAPPA
jgi:archaetidylinositol phosphate synthase